MTRRRSPWLAAALLAVGMLVPASSAPAAKTAWISYLEGECFAGQSKDGPWSKIGRGARLDPVVFLKTGDDTRIEVELADGSVLRIAPRSIFKLSEALFAKKEGRRLFAGIFLGSLWARASKALGGYDFKVTTTTAVAGVRGTTFRVDADSDNATTVKVYDGAVAVGSAKAYEKFQKEGGAPGERKEVAFPAEVTKKEWFDIILSRLQAVRIAADGTVGKPVALTEEEEMKDPWVAWNKARDAAYEKKHK